MARNDLGRIKGTTFKPQVNKGILSFTNDNNEENPAPVRVQGVSYIPHLNDKVLSFTNDGGLENPQTVDLNTIDRNLNIRFYDWFGTQKEYDEMKLRDTETRYNLYDESTGDTSLKFFRAKHPTSYYDERITRVIQADNKKLTSWDKYGDMPIKRQGNKPLDDYIVAQGDWGTIYSDGVVTVERLAPTTNEDYQLTLAQLEEIQNNDMMLLNDEGYTPFDFNSLVDHKTLINDINNSNIKTIDNTQYPITYTDGTTGEVISIEKPVLKQGEMPTPISFGCLVDKNNNIYIGQGYENYGKNVRKYGLEEPVLIDSKNGISKYRVHGTEKYDIGGISYLTYYPSGLTNQEANFYLNCKIRVKYLDKYVKPEVEIVNHTGVSVYFKNIKELENGWVQTSLAYKIPFKNFSNVTFVVRYRGITQGTIVNDRELTLEIDDDSFVLAKSIVELPYIPQGIIVPNCNLDFSKEIVFDDYSMVEKGIYQQGTYIDRQRSWNLGSGNILITLDKDANHILQSHSYAYGGKFEGPVSFSSKALGFKHHADLQSIGRRTLAFKQLLIYKGDLTQSELETERDKFLKMNNKYNNE